VNNEFLNDFEKDKNDNFYFIVNYWSSPWDCDFSANSSILTQLGGGDDVILHTDSTGSLIDYIKIATQYTDSYSRRLGQINGTLFLLGWYNGIPVDFDPSSNYNCPLFYGGGDITLAKYGFSNSVVTNQDQFYKLLGLQIYPNPASGYIKIKGIEQNVSIRINDLLGKTLLEKHTNEDCELNTEKLADGLYLVSILNNGIIITTSRLVIVGNK
jgi:hypothetical protein